MPAFAGLPMPAPARPGALSSMWRAPRGPENVSQPIDDMFRDVDLGPLPTLSIHSIPDEPAPELAREHHFFVLWRYGPHGVVVQRIWDRESIMNSHDLLSLWPAYHEAVVPYHEDS